MNILVIGSGGREHALCWKIGQSPLVQKLYCAPGNGGIEQVAECISMNTTDFPAIVKFCDDHRIGLVVIGPEDPLVGGLADLLEKAGIPAFGPSAAAARLEGSKAFTKSICDKYNIPTAAYGKFDSATAAREYIKKHGAPIVVKADGLAAGKGVVVAMTEDEALQAVDEIMGGKFGGAGNTVVIEEFMEGPEVSFFAICDGERAIELGSAQDHKRAFDNDEGPNTGGMGTYSPAPIMTPEIREEVMEKIIHPTMRGMSAEGAPFKGVLFAGLMLTKSGPRLLEFNTRFGDPETQVLMPRIDGDLVPLLLAAAKGDLEGHSVKLKDDAAVCVVMATRGYPGDYKKGSEIKNLDTAGSLPGVTVFHAGTKKEGDRILANGGRVLGVTATAPDFAAARTAAYSAVKLINWPEGFFRSDIGWRAL